jgi:hypothetical protein
MLVIEVAANLLVNSDKHFVQLKTLHEPIEIHVGMVHWMASTAPGVFSTGLGFATMIIAGLGLYHYLPSRREHPKRKKKTSNTKKPHSDPRDVEPPIDLVTHHLEHHSHEDAGHTEASPTSPDPQPPLH